MANDLNKPDYLFEVSWEVCNKVGGIYTVIATKSLYLKSQLKRHHILIGPDVWMDTDANPDFQEDPQLWQDWKAEAAKSGIRMRIGRWNVPGSPVAILVDFKQFLTDTDRILAKYWEKFGVTGIIRNLYFSDMWPVRLSKAITASILPEPKKLWLSSMSGRPDPESCT